MQIRNPYYKISIIICIILGVSLVFFSGYKAYFDSFTHDESKTWLDSIHKSVIELITFNYPESTTNNHLLNTLLMKACSILFGDSEFSLRLPTWIAHFIYIYFSIRLVQLLENKWLLLPGFILINFNPYLVDFFSMARGYGLALAFMMGSLYFLLKYIEGGGYKNNILSFVFCFLTVLANLTWLNYYIALFAAINLYLIVAFFKEKFRFSTHINRLLINNIPGLISGILLFLIFRNPIKILNAKKEFFFGGEKGFWIDTVGSLIKNSLYTSSIQSRLLQPVFLIILAILLISIILLILSLLTGRYKNTIQPVYLLFFMLVFAGFCTVLQHWFLGTLFLKDRTGILFIVLFMIFLVVFFDLIYSYKRFNLFAGILSGGLAFILFMHFIFVANLQSVYEYAYDANTKNMLIALEKDVPLDARKPEGIYVGMPWIFIPTTNFYKESKKMTWLKHLDLYKKDSLNAFDYMYIIGIDDNDRAQYRNEHKRIVAEFPSTRTALVKWK